MVQAPRQRAGSGFYQEPEVELCHQQAVIAHLELENRGQGEHRSGCGGKFSGGSTKWYKEGTKLVVNALPSSGHMFDGWYGSVSSKIKN